MNFLVLVVVLARLGFALAIALPADIALPKRLREGDAGRFGIALVPIAIGIFGYAICSRRPSGREAFGEESIS